MKADKIRLVGRQTVLHLRQTLAIRSGCNLCRPGNVYIAITHHCNFRCRMCRDWQTQTPELSLEEWRELFRRLLAWLPAGAKINISGGEPLVKRGLLDLLQDLDAGSRFPIGITSNGYLLGHEQAKTIMGLGLFNVNLSLDSLYPEVHDSLRGKEGAFAKMMAAINSLTFWRRELQADTGIVIKTIISRKNVGDLEQLVRLVSDKGLNGIYFQSIEQTFGEERDSQWHLKSDLWPDDQELVQQALQGLVRLKNEGQPILNAPGHLLSMIDYFRDPSAQNASGCTLGHTTLFIYPDGTLYFCPSFGAIGNLSQDDLETVWSGDRATKTRKAIRHCSKQCLLTCQYQMKLTDKARAFFSLISAREK